MVDRIDPKPGEILFDPSCGTGGFLTRAIRHMRDRHVKKKEHLLEECNLHTIVRLPNSVFKPYASIGTNLLFFEKGEPTKEVWFYEHHVPEGQKAYSMTKPILVEYLRGCIDWWGGVERKDRQETEVAWKVSLEEIKVRNYNLDCKNPHTVADNHGDPEELLAKLEQDEKRTTTLRDRLKAILAEVLLR